MWHRDLGEKAALELSHNPWQIFQPITRRLYFDVAVAETLWAQAAL